MKRIVIIFILLISCGEKTHEPVGGILHLGDSITHGCAHLLQPPHYSLAIPGDTTQGAMSVWDSVGTELRPYEVHILIGINDAIFGMERGYEANLTALVREVQISGAKVYLWNLLPTNRVRHETLIEMRKVVASITGVVIIDKYDLFLRKGSINLDLFTDGLHLNQMGCQLLF
jgi:lysophospholipase L1-like esterase